MNIIVIKTQQKFDVLPDSFTEYTEIQIRNDRSLGSIVIKTNKKNAFVVAYNNAYVTASGNASVVAYNNASVRAFDKASVRAFDKASVRAYDKASVRAYDKASVAAFDKTSVEASGKAFVRAHNNASVRAYDYASVRAYGNASVDLCSKQAKVELHENAACWFFYGTNENQVTIHSPTATLAPITDAKSWLKAHRIRNNRGYVTLFKRVSADLKTQEKTPNETTWTVGSVLEHSAWNPTQEECGDGKFHACPTPAFCDEFRSDPTDQYVAIKIAVSDLFVWTNSPSYPHKIAFRKGKVLYVCDRLGKKL